MKTFDFVKIRTLPPKPRKSGILEARVPYYASVVTVQYIKGILEAWSDYFDGFKFACGTMRLLDRQITKQIIDMCHDYDIYVSTGGFVERVWAQGPKAVNDYFEECKALEYDVVEISSGLAPIPLDDKVEMVKEVKRMGMKPKPEVSFMIGAGAGTHVANYKPKLRSLADVLKEIEMHQRVGVPIMMFESEGITEDLPPNKWRLDLLKGVLKKYDYKKWMFEGADPVVFKWYLKNVGKDVNLFIDHSQITEINAWRLGLWGDPDIWKGKKPGRYRSKA